MFSMPFPSVPCAIWYAHEEGADPYGNVNVSYADAPDVRTRCVYAPGNAEPDTADDVSEGHPMGDGATMTFFLPKDFQPTQTLRGALIACYPPDDALLSARKWQVVGDPMSYPRDAVPGDYSWRIEGVAWLG